MLSGKHLPFLKSKPRQPSGWRGFYFPKRAIAVAFRATNPAPASAVPNDRGPADFPDQFFGRNLGVWLSCEIIRGDDAGYRRTFNRGGWLSNGCYSRAPMPWGAVLS
jgi:hypothetical protein